MFEKQFVEVMIVRAWMKGVFFHAKASVDGHGIAMRSKSNLLYVQEVFIKWVRIFL